MDYSTFLSFAQSRRSIRQYTQQKVEPSVIEKLVEAAAWAPSNHNRQGWKFIVFQDRQEIEQLAQATREAISSSLADASALVAAKAQELIHYAGLFQSAPVVILAMHKKSPAMSKTLTGPATASPLASGEIISTAMACQNLILAAHALGLGACIMTAPLLAGEVWSTIDDLPAGYEPNCLITAGYPAETPQPPRRKNLEHIIEFR